MSYKTNKTNPLLITLIHDLKKLSIEKGVTFWKDIALRLEKSNKNWPVVSLSHIDKHVNEKETAIITGKVLSTGTLNKKISIAAWSFSEKAIKKITKAGGTTMTLEELMKKNPDGKNIRIIG